EERRAYDEEGIGLPEAGEGGLELAVAADLDDPWLKPERSGAASHGDARRDRPRQVGIHEHGESLETRDGLLQKRQTLAFEVDRQRREPGHVPAGPGKARNEPGNEGIVGRHDDDA